jgi:hypothetical protein
LFEARPRSVISHSFFFYGLKVRQTSFFFYGAADRGRSPHNAFRSLPAGSAYHRRICTLDKYIQVSHPAIISDRAGAGQNGFHSQDFVWRRFIGGRSPHNAFRSLAAGSSTHRIPCRLAGCILVRCLTASLVREK